MDMKEARKVAHRAVATLIRVNNEIGEGDMWLDVDVDHGHADRDRITRAFDEIADYHAKRGAE